MLWADKHDFVLVPDSFAYYGKQRVPPKQKLFYHFIHGLPSVVI